MRWLLAVILAASAATAADWEPARTTAFVVGVLKWQHRDWDSFPKEGRRDAELVRLLRSRGVSRIEYLKDGAATLKRIRARFARVLAASKPGDLLIFYYCGHGFEDGGATYFANADAGDARSSWWSLADVIDAIERGFRGDRALLLADCCHSGALVDEVKKRSPRLVAYAVITSATAGDESTSNWTFTQSVLDALGGEGRIDRNRDAAITLFELAHYASAEMRAFEKQPAASLFTERFPLDTRIARVRAGPRLERSGERVEVQYDGSWWPARIVRVEGARALVRWVTIGFDRPADQEWVPLATVRPLTVPQGTVTEGARRSRSWDPRARSGHGAATEARSHGGRRE